MGIMKLIKGEPMPDKNDPKYRARYEKEVQAGRDFANKSGLTWVTNHIYRWAFQHKKAFLVIVFGIVGICFLLNVINLVRYMSSGSSGKGATAVELVDSATQGAMRNR